jgi:hypothetical protein
MVRTLIFICLSELVPRLTWRTSYFHIYRFDEGRSKDGEWVNPKVSAAAVHHNQQTVVKAGAQSCSRGLDSIGRVGASSNDGGENPAVVSHFVAERGGTHKGA